MKDSKEMDLYFWQRRWNDLDGGLSFQVLPPLWMAREEEEIRNAGSSVTVFNIYYIGWVIENSWKCD